MNRFHFSETTKPLTETRRPLIPAFSPSGGEGVRRTDEGVRHRKLDTLSTKRNFPRLNHFNPHRFATKPNFRTDVPSRCVTWAGLVKLKLFFQPAAIAFHESSRLGLRTAARNRHPRLAIRAQPQQVASRAGISHEQQRHSLRSKLKRFQRCRSFSRCETVDEIQPH